MARYLIRNAAEFARLSQQEQEEWHRAGDALATSRREGISLSAAARREGTTLEMVRRNYAPAVTRRGQRGWYRATHWDRAYRGSVHLTTRSGDRLVELRDSRSRSHAAEYANALTAYMSGVDPTGEGLRRFRGRRLGGHRLFNDRDLDVIDELVRRGEVDWPDFYERV